MAALDRVLKIPYIGTCTYLQQQRPNGLGDWEYLAYSQEISVTDTVGKYGFTTPRALWRPPTQYSTGGVVKRTAVTIDSYYEQKHIQAVSSNDLVVRCSGQVLFPDPPHLTGDLVPDWVDGMLINKCLSELKDQRVNLGVALAETKSSIATIASGATRIYQAYSAVRRGQFGRAAKILRIPSNTFRSRSKDAAKNWLEVTYGWTPILMDVHGSCEFIADRIRSTPLYVSKRARWKDLVESPEWTEPFGTDYHRWTLSNLDSWELQRDLTLHYQLDNRGLHDLSSLGLLNPTAIAWELVPFSFVWDWWNPVGDYLNLLDADKGFLFKGGCFGLKSTARRKSALRTPEFKYYPPPQWASSMIEADYASSQPGYAERVQFNRSPIFIAPKSQIYLKSPFTSVRRAINAVALVRALV